MKVQFDYETTGYSDIFAPKIPSLIVKNLLATKSKKISVLIDTGFDGFLVIPEELFEELELYSFEVVEDEIPVVETFSGETFTLRTANAIIEINNLLNDTIIEVDTTPYCKEPLIGRQLLEIFKTTLDGPSQILVLEYQE
ncbi:MAG: clan AA aspartic protease [Candidatus Hodarchaeales archaeon]